MIKAHPSSNIRARIGPRSRTAEGPKCDWPSELIPASRVRIVVGIFLTQLMGIQWWWRWWSKIHFGMDHRYPQIFFPTLTCGVFVFSAVSAPPSSRLSSHSHTHISLVQHHSHTHPNHTHTTHSHTSHSHIHRTHITFFTHPTHTSHIHTHTHSHTYPTHTGLGALQRGRKYALASLRCPSLTHTSHTHLTLTHTYIPITHTHHTLTHISPLVSAALPVPFAWQARDLVHCKGVGCTPWRPSGVPPVSFGLRRSAGGFCVAGVGLGALQRGRMYALASLRCPSVVPPVSLGLRRSAGGFCVAGSRMYALASLRITHTHIPITHTHHTLTHTSHSHIHHTH